MTPGVRVAAFSALLAAIFALAAIAGRATGPVSLAGDEPDHGAAAGGTAGHEATAGAAAPQLRMAAGDTTLAPGRPQRFEFEIRRAGGAPVRSFEVEQGRRMHLVVVRRDLRRFQHLHPAQSTSGSWSIDLTLPDAGVYHAFADFQVAGARHVLGVDLFAPGRFEPLALPPAGTIAAAGKGRYEVTLSAEDGELEFAVSRDGAPVRDLQPYLGADGHLVMLRAGDLAYEHVHPLRDRRLAFATAAAAPGTYRLFLQFRHAGRVRTAAFTYEVTP